MVIEINEVGIKHLEDAEKLASPAIGKVAIPEWRAMVNDIAAALAGSSTLKQLEEIKLLISEHQDKQRYSQGFGTPAEKVKSIMREYEDKTTRAYSDVKHVRDDMLTFFRALALVLNMTGEAATHAEKNARLRGAIELLESAIEKLRHQNLESLFDIYRWPDLFRSDWPTRRLMDRIHDLERQVKDLQPDNGGNQREDGLVSDAEPQW